MIGRRQSEVIDPALRVRERKTARKAVCFILASARSTDGLPPLRPSRPVRIARRRDLNAVSEFGCGATSSIAGA